MAASVIEPITQQNPPQHPSCPHISLAEILSALSFALDFTEGAMPGHTLRSCLLGMRLARELGLAAEEMVTLYYALLLKDIGCSSQAGRVCGILEGSDGKRRTGRGTTADSSHQVSLPLLWNGFDPSVRRQARMARVPGCASSNQNRREPADQFHFERSARILRKLDLQGTVAQAVSGLNEQWDGSGEPDGLAGTDIPLLARIMAVARYLDLTATEQGSIQAIHSLRSHKGSRFDPKVIWMADWLHRKGGLWTAALPETPEDVTRRVVLDLVPLDVDRLETCDIDLICEAFADVVDARSSFTYRHSQSVTCVAEAIAQQLGLADERVRLVHRAALLHDIGKLRIPSSILNKPGSLDFAEWRMVHEHPRLTRQILSHIGAFQELAMIAGAHHERLDGTGYPDHLQSNEIPIEARIIAVADVYDALTGDRPYRPGMPHEEAMAVITRESPHRLDPECCRALSAAVSQPHPCTVQ